jgi:hypothetical protein
MSLMSSSNVDAKHRPVADARPDKMKVNRATGAAVPHVEGTVPRTVHHWDDATRLPVYDDEVAAQASAPAGSAPSAKDQIKAGLIAAGYSPEDAEKMASDAVKAAA